MLARSGIVDSEHHERDRRAPAFTVIEAVFGVLIIAILVAVLLPALGAARVEARKSASLSNARTHAASVTAFATDSGDSTLPWPGRPDAAGFVDTPSGGRASYFSFKTRWPDTLEAAGHQTAAAPDTHWSPFADSGGRSYWLSCANSSAPEYWNTTTRTGVDQLVKTKLSNVRFPASKMVVVDSSAFALLLDGSRRGTFFIASFFDGSAEASTGPTGDAVESGDGLLPAAIHRFDLGRGLHTLDGIRGRDR